VLLVLVLLVLSSPMVLELLFLLLEWNQSAHSHPETSRKKAPLAFRRS
jgi:hypothetical protein